MKKLILIVVLLISTSVLSQRFNHEKMKAYKTAYITEQLELTSSEAEKFWPIYNTYYDKTKALRKESRSKIKGRTKENQINNLSDSEANKIIENILAIKTKELQYHTELINNLKGVLSPIKILKLEIAEEEFKRKLLDRLKKHRNKKN
ncbi:MAG: sensor of ECF-type sigma factor [Flavobacteriaceae bacterium]|nr:sensor of ECF-type sigma factor [Flavobacteriaceae bacterium]